MGSSRARSRRQVAPSKTGWSSPFLFALVIGAAGVGTYWNSLGGPFIWDDQVSIVTNPSIQQVWPLSGPLRPPRETPVAGRPIVNLSFAINYAIGGLSERGYHVANIATHISCALLLFGIVRRTVEKKGYGPFFRGVSEKGAVPLFLAAGAALLWMVHPLQSDAVNYITQRTESLMALFFLLTLYAAIRARDGSTKWRVLAVAACACGMASKESMVTAPLVVLLYDRVFEFASLRGAVKARARLYLGLAATWLVLAALLWQQPRTTAGLSTAVAPWTYLLNQARMIARYLWLSVWPRALVLDYGLPRPLTVSDVLPAALGIAALVTVSVVALVRWPAVGFLCVGFFLTLAPTSSIVPIASEVGAERRMYLPFAALAVLVAIAFRWLVDRTGTVRPSKGRLKANPAYVGVVVLAALAARTVYRNADYREPITLWRTTVERWPHGRARMALATELETAGDRAQAIVQLREAVKDFPDARAALGTELIFSGQKDDGIAVLREFIRTDPGKLNRFPAHLGIAEALASEGKLAETAGEWRAMLTLIPSDEGVRARLVETLRSLAETRIRQSDYSEGERYATEALRLAPNDGPSHSLLGIALASQGNIGDAIGHFRRAVEIDPGNAQARANLERALTSTSRPRPRTDGPVPR